MSPFSAALAGDGVVLLRIVFPGMLLGFFGGVVAAILPWGDNAWGGRQAFRVMVLGAFAGLGVALWLSDLAICTAQLTDGCVWPGRRLFYEFAGGFLAEQAFLVARAAGRAEIARAARAGLSYLARVTGKEGDDNP